MKWYDGGMSHDFEDQLQPEDTLDDRGVDDVLDEGYSPPEMPRASGQHAHTPNEFSEGETLEERLQQEEPDVVVDPDAPVEEFLDDGEVGDERTGRIAEGGEGEDGLGEDVGIDGAGASAEEAAMHTVDDGPL
jgi:hypothetical protein